MKMKHRSHLAALVSMILAVLIEPRLFVAASGRAFEGIGPTQVDAFEYRELPSFGEKRWINDDFYFIYEFTEKPKIGPAILQIQVFDRSTIIKESHL
ncbi:MAG: hypothetical protein ACUVV5_08370, partial [Candidatus Aminicenantales bacterium]